MRGFIHTGQAAVNTAALELEHYDWNTSLKSLSFSKSLFVSYSLELSVIASVAKGCVTDANVAHRDKHVTL